MKTRTAQLIRFSCYIFTFFCLSLIRLVQVKQIITVAHISASAKHTFPRRNILFHGKTYLSTAKLTFSRQNVLFQGKTYFSTTKHICPWQNLLFHGKNKFSKKNLTFPRQNILFHGKRYFSTAKHTFPRQNFTFPLQNIIFPDKTLLFHGKTYFSRPPPLTQYNPRRPPLKIKTAAINGKTGSTISRKNRGL